MTYNQAPNACDECAGEVLDDDAAPSCGAHLLHHWCAPWFSCKDCTFELRQVSC